MTIPDNYRLFKFKNGEDVIAEYFETPEDTKNYILHRPMKFQVMMGMDKNLNPVPQKLIMTEWLAFSQNDTAVVPRDTILCWSKPSVMIAKVYDNEKRRIDEMRSKIDMDAAPPNELDKTDKPGKPGKPGKPDEKRTSEKKAIIRKLNKLHRKIHIVMSLENLMRFLESVGLDIEDEPWKTVVNPPDMEDDDDLDEDDDDEESPSNLDGSLDIMPDVDGEGFVDPFGNPWDGPTPT